MKDKLKQIRKISEEFFQSLGWEPEVNIEISEKIIFLKINTAEPSLLIGKGGVNLDSLQHILRLMINKRLDEFIHLVVDVADYKNKQRIFLEQDSLQKALEVRQSSQTKRLKPMNSYERRIIHLTLKDVDGISCESNGEGIERRIVIKPINSKQ